MVQLLLLAVAIPAFSQLQVTTRSYNNQRTNANLAETTLNQSNVNVNQFGKLFDLKVDDEVYSQILYMQNLGVNGALHDVIFVATVNNSVFAFDANAAGNPLWTRNFGSPSRNTDVGNRCVPYLDFSGNIGIVSTPVIDAASGTMFLVTRNGLGAATTQTLRAIDIHTGATLREATISAPGFNAHDNNQRASLGLANGVIYIGWSSFCDTGNYHGFEMAFLASDLTRVGLFNATPTQTSGAGGGIWGSGSAPAIDDAGNVYVSTGNSDAQFNGNDNMGESVVKLEATSLAVRDYFTAANFANLNGADLDLGSGNALIMPNTTALVTGGKEGKLYALDINNMGGLGNDTQILDSFQAVLAPNPNRTEHIHNGIAAWNGPQGINVYLSGENDFVRSYHFNTSTGKFDHTPMVGGFLLPAGMPGSQLTLSANGSQPGTGILWSFTPRLGDANHKVVPGVLTAYNAETLGTLWTSGASVGDDTFSFSKGAPPTVANGKVYVANFSNRVVVYGNRITPPPSSNLALGKVATGSTPCAANQGPDKAVNGSYSGGLADKFCSSSTPTFLQVDLGSSKLVDQFIVEHAGAGGEGGTLDGGGRPNFALNSKAYTIQISNDGINFTTVVTATNNIQSISTHSIAQTNVRFVRLNVTSGVQTGTNTRANLRAAGLRSPIAAGAGADR